MVFLTSQPHRPPMELLNSQPGKTMTYTVNHNDVEYFLTDYFGNNGYIVIDTILKDKFGNVIEDDALMEEITTFLDKVV
jgi:hypothetical protein